MVPVLHPSLLFKSLKMSPLSLLSAILVIRSRLGLDEALSEVGHKLDEVSTQEAVAVDSSRELEDGEVSRVTTAMTAGEDVAVRVVDDGLAGRTMTSHSVTVMHLLTSSLTGKCLRRLISTALPS